MASQVVSFRFSDQEIELLRQRSLSPDESINAIAQRLLREVIGVSTSLSTNVDAFSERVQAVVDARIEAIVSQVVDNRLQEEMGMILGECSA